MTNSRRKRTPRRPSSSQEAESETGPIRLQRFLAQSGLGSRRKCEEYITSGRITVDGEPADELGVRVDPQSQTVCLDGERIRREPKRYFLLNKPAGCVCTNRDPDGRPRAIDLVPQNGPRLFTVGRLDETSRGLLLITNDGELAHRLAHPRFQVQRRYEVQVAGKPTAETLQSLTDGLRFSDGRFRIDGYRRRRVQKNSTFLDIVLTEGRNREIRRLFARVGHKVLKLQRIAFGPLKLGRVKEGEFRPLTGEELTALQELAGPPAAGKSKAPNKPRTARKERDAESAKGAKGQRRKRATGPPKPTSPRHR